MKQQLVLAFLVFVAVVVICPNAHAQDGTEIQVETQVQIQEDQVTGFYVGGHLGANTADSEVNGGTLATDEDTLIGFGGVLGYDFGYFRVDGELALRFNTIDRLGGISLNPPSVWKGDPSTTKALSYMVNGYFDLPTDGPLSFYAGAGIGFATVSIDWKAPGVFFSHVPVADDNDSGLAYQFSGGIGYEIDFDREINPITIVVTLGYRYFATEELQMMFASSSPINPGSPFTIEYQSHEFLIGARVLFH
jgi:opacity protein-like surface antigen